MTGAKESSGIMPRENAGESKTQAAAQGSPNPDRHLRITGMVITLNEEKNIARAIESLRCCDEVLVVDSDSIDRTREVAAARGARVIQNPWPGFAQQKNFAQEQASYDWILSLDADEALGEELETEIWEIRERGPVFDAYSMPRLAQYLGKWIQHSGWYPDRKVRLYDRRRTQWTGAFVHETARVQGSVGELHGNLLHYTCDSISQHLKSLDRYTSLAAAEILANQGSPNSTNIKSPVPISKMLLSPPWTFVRTYLLQQGYRDGLHGLAIANMAALYTFLKYFKAAAGWSEAREKEFEDPAGGVH